MIKRDAKICLNNKGNNAYDVTDKNGKLLLSADENYFIYFKNVNFKNDGSIEGRYLGDIKPDSALIDGYCRDVSFNGDTFTIAGTKGTESVRSARMVAVDNKTRTIIIIQN
jgi:hypothetical protein